MSQRLWLSLTVSEASPELAGKKTLIDHDRQVHAVGLCMLRGHQRETHQKWKNRPSACAPRLKVSPEMMSTSPPASELLLNRAIPHAPCPSSSSFYYHDVELLQLEQERKPARMSVKTYFLLFRTLAIDRLSHVLQEREPTISQFLRNVAVRPKLWHTTVQPHLDWVRFRPSETSFNMATAAETKWRWDLHMVNWLGKGARASERSFPQMDQIRVIWKRATASCFYFEQRGSLYKGLTNQLGSRSVSHFLHGQPPAIDNASESNAKMYARLVNDWREKKELIYVTIISTQKTGTSMIFPPPFSTTFLRRIFLNPTGIDYVVGPPTLARAHFRQTRKMVGFPNMYRD